ASRIHGPRAVNPKVVPVGAGAAVVQRTQTPAPVARSSKRSRSADRGITVGPGGGGIVQLRVSFFASVTWMAPGQVSAGRMPGPTPKRALPDPRADAIAAPASAASNTSPVAAT